MSWMKTKATKLRRKKYLGSYRVSFFGKGFSSRGTEDSSSEESEYKCIFEMESPTIVTKYSKRKGTNFTSIAMQIRKHETNLTPKRKDLSSHVWLAIGSPSY